jgi:hypothetical protein
MWPNVFELCDRFPGALEERTNSARFSSSPAKIMHFTGKGEGKERGEQFGHPAPFSLGFVRRIGKFGMEEKRRR